MYHLPLLPGYGPGINVRSSPAPAPPTPTADDAVPLVSEAEETADEGGYFSSMSAIAEGDSFSPSTSPAAGLAFSDAETMTVRASEARAVPQPKRSPSLDPDTFGEAVFFAYGVVVFFGFDESQEHSILDDIEMAETMQKPLPEERWEVEECHYEACSYASYQKEEELTFFNSTSRSLPILAFTTTSLVSCTLSTAWSPTHQAVQHSSLIPCC